MFFKCKPRRSQVGFTQHVGATEQYGEAGKVEKLNQEQTSYYNRDYLTIYLSTTWHPYIIHLRQVKNGNVSLFVPNDNTTIDNEKEDKPEADESVPPQLAKQGFQEIFNGNEPGVNETGKWRDSCT